MTIAEEVLPLACRDDTGTPLIGSVELDAALAGAVLAELTVSGRIDLERKKVMVTDPAPLGDEELDAALARITGEGKERKPEWWVGKLNGGKLRKRLLTRLAARGVLSEQERKILGIFPATRYPELDPSVEQGIRRRIEGVLGGTEPSERDAVLIAILNAAKLDRKVFPRASRKRIKEITEGEWAGAAVRKTITAVHGSVVAAAATAGVAATGGS